MNWKWSAIWLFFFLFFFFRILVDIAINVHYWVGVDFASYFNNYEPYLKDIDTKFMFVNFDWKWWEAGSKFGAWRHQDFSGIWTL